MKGCEGCGCLTFSPEWHKAFGIMLCNSCKRNEPLITKATAKKIYMVTDGDLRKLGSLAKANPQHKEWSAMRLYMQSQVEAIAHKKHGGQEGLEDHRRATTDAKLEIRLKRRSQDDSQDAEESARLARIKRRLEEGHLAKDGKPDDMLDKTTGATKRVYPDGATVEVEMI